MKRGVNADIDAAMAEMADIWEDDTEHHTIELSGLTHREVLYLVVALETQIIHFKSRGDTDAVSSVLDIRSRILDQTPDLYERVTGAQESAIAGGADLNPDRRLAKPRFLFALAMAILFLTGLVMGAYVL